VTGTSLAVFACVRVFFRAAIVLAGVLAASPFAVPERRQETDTQCDLGLFLFYQQGDRAVGVDSLGQPTEDAERAPLHESTAMPGARRLP
jgi:hypothetical protein